jgi:F0F1-type ATP synthase alpha subunit
VQRRAMKLLRLGSDLVAMRSPVERLRPGQLLRLGDNGGRAAVLCARGGTLVASVLPSQPGVAHGVEISDGMEASVVHGEMARAPLGDTNTLGGRVIDFFGHPLDGGAPLLPSGPAARIELFGRPPTQAELWPIDRSLHTGTAAIDALTPIGRGQTMMLFGSTATGKSGIAWDAVLSQATSDVHCVLALSDGGSERGVEMLEELRRRGNPSAVSRCTIVSAVRDSVGERMMCLAAAAAVGEQVRNSGGHALVVADELRGLCELWEVAGDASAKLGGLLGAAADTQHSAEQRIFYASYLQRASQLNSSLGGGSMTVLGLQRQTPARESALPAPTASDADGDAHHLRLYTLDDFTARPQQQRSRIEALLSRGVRIDAKALARLGIEPPTAELGVREGVEKCLGVGANAESTDHSVAADDAAARRSVGHVDQLMSLADGHIFLHSERAEAGFWPATVPSDSLARVGAGSQHSEGRAQPATPAMQRVAQTLRLELAQARDLLPPDPSDSEAVKQQRTRAAAVEVALCSQSSGAPLRLSHEIVLLHALAAGHLDHLAGEPPIRAAAEVRALLDHVERQAPEEIREIDTSGELSRGAEQLLLEHVSELLPKMSGRAFWTSWDPSVDR